MNERITFHFTIGPVQSFVTQARRTRDLAIGSFLLSYLAGVAMQDVIDQDGEIRFPAIENAQGQTAPLLRAIRDVTAGEKPAVPITTGSLPNRFFADVPAAFDPIRCQNAVNRIWNNIAQAVFQRFVEPVIDFGKDTADIWERQVHNFWEISWAIGDESNVLDMRKNWRSYIPPVEYGDKCTLMGQWQELSGYARSRERRKQDLFWQELRKSTKRLDLTEGERLCAIALIKRVLPDVAEQTIGWPLPSSYPSTPYLATIHWIEEITKTEPEKAREFGLQASKLEGGSISPIYRDIPCLARLVKQDETLRDFVSLDGNCFFRSALENDALWSASKKDREALIKNLGAFNNEPSPYYAILLMDGDHMGRLLQSFEPPKGEPNHISLAVSAFSEAVPGIARQHDSVTIYAGGDDVLAFCPLEDAIPLSIALRNEYLRAFERYCSQNMGIRQRATISAAIVYAHCRGPLQQALAEAHKLLDEVAKRKCGRDSLAVCVWRTAGTTLTWAAPWTVVFGQENNDNTLPQIASEDQMVLLELVQNLTKDNGKSVFSSSFLYNLRKHYGGPDRSGREIKGISDHQFRQIMLAEYLRSQREPTLTPTIEKCIDQLAHICHQYYNKDDGTLGRREYMNLDGVLLARFLEAKEV
ncbi:MAG: type III-B CRISPR-associated protein Cas10/Cmr2 [Limnochordia bacterium]|nr:type III-B CRISPR-associated protein Cas10/Cmr2 [Limnochordia bacterium]